MITQDYLEICEDCTCVVLKCFFFQGDQGANSQNAKLYSIYNIQINYKLIKNAYKIYHGDKVEEYSEVVIIELVVSMK